MFSGRSLKLGPLAWAALLVVLTLNGSAPRVLGQINTGTVRVVTEDAEGNPVPGVEVRLEGGPGELRYSGVSDESGTCRLAGIPAGSYQVAADKEGSENTPLTGLQIGPGDTLEVHLTLGSGRPGEKPASLLDESGNGSSTVIGEVELQQLPLREFRDVRLLLTLAPGVSPLSTDSAEPREPATSPGYSINGTSGIDATRVDGASATGIWKPYQTNANPFPEAVESVRVTTGGFTPELGLAGGAAPVTILTRSGTNQFHGSVFGFHENGSWNARNFFNFVDQDEDGLADAPGGRRNQAGIAFGGPIRKKKAFFYGGWEGSFQDLPFTSLATVPTEEMRGGDFSAFSTRIYDPLTGTSSGLDKTPFEGNIIPSSRLADPAIKAMALIPLPNLDGYTNNYEASGTESFVRHNIDLKVDWNLTPERRFWGKLAWLDATFERDAVFGRGGGGAIGGGGDGEGHTQSKVFGFGHVWDLTPSVLLEGSASYIRLNQDFQGADIEEGNFGEINLGIQGTNASDEGLCLVDGVNRCGGVPAFLVEGYSPFGQVSSWSPLFYQEDSVTLNENFSWAFRNHEIRWGYDGIYGRLDHWQPASEYGPRGLFTFGREMTGVPGQDLSDQNAWAGFLLGYQTSMGKSLQWQEMKASEWQHAFYVRDQWQMSPRLSLMLGLRYEFFPLARRKGSPLEHLDLETFEVNLAGGTDAGPGLFAPRLGAAFRIDSESVIRAGYGAVIDPTFLSGPLRGSYPFVIAAGYSTSNPYRPFSVLREGLPVINGPDLEGVTSVLLPPSVLQRTLPAGRLNRGYVHSWHLQYERRLPQEFVVWAGYAGTRTVDQFGYRDLNWSGPGEGNEGRQYYPLSSASILLWDGAFSSDYHALQLALNRRFTDGLFLKAAYTFSKGINMTDGEGWTSLLWNDPSLSDRNRAVSGFDRPHMLQAAAIYSLPFGRGRGGILAFLTRGWQLNGIFSFNQNVPFTVTASDGSLNAMGNTQTADQILETVERLGGIGVGNPYFNPAAFAPVIRIPGADCSGIDCYGSSGRNILRGPSWTNLDFSVSRDFHLTEGLSVQFRAEVFNLSNTAHFENPNGDASSSSFMLITSTSRLAPPRVIRFGMRIHW